MNNLHGTVIAAEDPEIISPNSYNTELEFDTGLTGVRWEANCKKPFAKQDYYESDVHNIVKGN